MTGPAGLEQKRERRQLDGLEAGRGVAAMLVVLCHCTIHCLHIYGVSPLGGVFTFGHAGVDFFFVLSGFIIFNTHWRDLGRPDRIARYLGRRFTRIYPLYWIILGLTVLMAALSPHPFPGPGMVVSSILLSPTRGGIIVVDAWTLQHEMLFYAIFAVLLLNKRLGLFAFGIWLAFLLVNAVLEVPFQSGLLWKLSSYFNFEFFLGIFVAWAVVKREIPLPRLMVVAGVAGFAAVGTAENMGLIVNTNIFTHAGYGLSAMFVVMGLVAWERRFGLAVPRFLMVLGGASYAIYLVHLLAIAIIWQAVLHAGLSDKLGPTVVFAILLVGAATAGILTSIWLEKPLTKLLRRRESGSPARNRSDSIELRSQ